MTNYFVYTDGGARNNPGPAGIGVVVQNNKKETIKEIKKYLGNLTNNQAEYWAIIYALEWIVENINESDFCIEHFLDSELIEQQLKGNYKVKNEGLKPLYIKVNNLIKKIPKIKFTHVYRHLNKRADQLVNEAIDEAKK